MEEKKLAEGELRVRFQCKWKAPISSLYNQHPGLERSMEKMKNDMADALLELEAVGATPVLPDGKVGGNAVIRFKADNKEYLLVSKSGKLAHHRMEDADFCVVTSFNEDDWTCEYLSVDNSVLPTCDTPLHFSALNAHKKLDWTEVPHVALHGHALETEEKARRFDLPISSEETLCSTPQDSDALFKIMQKYSYPEHKLFIRKGHGFFLMAKSITDARHFFMENTRKQILELAEEVTAGKFDHKNMEEKKLAEGELRVRFQCKWKAPISSLYNQHPGLERSMEKMKNDMADALLELEAVGATPVLPDGKVGGNAVIRFNADDKEYLLVSKSGKLAHHRMEDADFCVVTSFNEDDWTCEYLSVDDSVLPTCDTPMHFRALNAHKKLDWTEVPHVALHGHALETEEKAKRFDLPISSEETLCSTPQDSDALFNIMQIYSYPEHKIFIRKGHGFFLMAKSMTDARHFFMENTRKQILELSKENNSGI